MFLGDLKINIILPCVNMYHISFLIQMYNITDQGCMCITLRLIHNLTNIVSS